LVIGPFFPEPNESSAGGLFEYGFVELLPPAGHLSWARFGLVVLNTSGDQLALPPDSSWTIRNGTTGGPVAEAHVSSEGA
jgi:hypothetical protein